MTRRDLLKSGGASAAALAVGGGDGYAAAPAEAAGSVIVIGGGFGGLACAEALMTANVAVTLLEADARTGGRVLSDSRILPGHPVELGAEWIGKNHATWIALAKKYNISLVAAPDVAGATVIELDGKFITGADADALYKEVDEARKTACQLARDIDPVRPWTAPNADRLDRQTFTGWAQSLTISANAKKLLIIAEEADNGVAGDQMSLLAYLALLAGGGFEKYFSDTETHRTANGNDSLAKALATALGDRIKLKHAVKKITRRTGSVIVECEHGAVFAAGAVVLAVPPTLWGKMEFVPLLPPQMKLQMGKNTKLILNVSKPVWKDTGLSPDLEGDGLIGLSWVAAGPVESGASVFTLFSWGENCVRLAQMEPRERTARATQSLAAAYPGLGAAVTAARFMNWPEMPRTRGSYSFPAPGEITTFGKMLVEGLTGDGLAPLHFAGEHTSYAFVGYMEGALSSGTRVAAAILPKPAGK